MLSVLNRAIALGILFFISAQASADATLSQEQLGELSAKANAGDMAAQVELADRYYAGNGVSKDLKQAATLYNKLADNGVAQAQMTLALMYIRGEGVAQDNEKAHHWLIQAAEQRLAPAQYFLGLAYAEGHGVEINNITAYMWFEIAAAMDHKDALAATKTLAEKMSREDVLTAEQQATEWWMRFHH